MSRLPALPIQLDARSGRNLGSSAVYRAGTIASTAEGCPGYLIADLYGTQIAPVDDRAVAREPWPVIIFALADAIREVERGGMTVEVALERALATASKDGIGLHPGAREFLEHALRTYLEFSAERNANAAGPLELGGTPEIIADQLTLRAWALHYASPDADRRVREVRRLRYTKPRTDEQAFIWAAVAAKVATDGVLPDRDDVDPAPEVVRVIEVSLLDGASVVLLDTDAAGARAEYNRLARPQVDALQNATTLRPGYDCAKCRWVATCPAVPTARGLLGSPRPAVLEGRWNPLGRSVSASDLDRYAMCPSLFHLARNLYLPREHAPSDASLRGLAVHRWLRAAHERSHLSSCTAEDLPEGGPDPLGVLDSREYAVAWPFLRHHPRLCVLGMDELDHVAVERRHAVFDPDADALVVASPDLSFRASGRTVWRETKSTIKKLPADEFGVLERFGQACLDLVMLARGVADGGDSGMPHSASAVLEFEVLSVEDSELYLFRAVDAALVARAEQLVAAITHEWSQDTMFTALPDRRCAHCEVRRWCPNRNDPPVRRAPSARDLEASWYDDTDAELGF